MHDALGAKSTEELESVLIGLCNSVITEEECKNQVIQDALNVSCNEEMNDVLSKINGDFSPDKKPEGEYSKSNEENISNEAHFSLQLEESSSDEELTTTENIIEISDSDDAESVVVRYYFAILLNDNIK